MWKKCNNIVGHAKPKIWFKPGVGRELYSIISGSNTFFFLGGGQILFLYMLTVYYNIFCSKMLNAYQRTKQNDPYFFMIISQLEKSKLTSFLGCLLHFSITRGVSWVTKGAPKKKKKEKGKRAKRKRKERKGKEKG